MNSLDKILAAPPSFWAGSALSVCVICAIISIARESKGPGIAGSWGGFGGTKTDWHLSKSLGFIALSVVMAIVFIAVTFRGTEPPANSNGNSSLRATQLEVSVQHQESNRTEQPGARSPGK